MAAGDVRSSASEEPMVCLTPAIEKPSEVCLTQPPKTHLSLETSSTLLSYYHRGPSLLRSVLSPSAAPSSALNPSPALRSPATLPIPYPNTSYTVLTNLVTSTTVKIGTLVPLPPDPPSSVPQATYASVVAPKIVTDSPDDSWAHRLKSSVRNLRKMSDPTILDDGTPLVKAPASILSNE